MEMSSELEIPATASDLPEIAREELRRRLRDTSLIVVDVLPVESYAMGHIPGAINLPYESIASRARELLPNPLAEIVVYCAKFT
jgi:rhodanese-related sulfurtransferase